MKTILRWLSLTALILLFVNSAFAHYDPRLGRFLSRDPAGEEGGFNLYAYCANDPVNRWDYLGMAPVPAFGGKGTRFNPDLLETYSMVIKILMSPLRPINSYSKIMSNDTEKHGEGVEELANGISGGVPKMVDALSDPAKSKQFVREATSYESFLTLGYNGLLFGFGAIAGTAPEFAPASDLQLELVAPRHPALTKGMSTAAFNDAFHYFKRESARISGVDYSVVRTATAMNPRPFTEVTLDQLLDSRTIPFADVPDEPVPGEYVHYVRPGAEQTYFRTAWTDRNFGKRIADDFDPLTGTLFEGTLLDFDRIAFNDINSQSLYYFNRKLAQAATDRWLLRNNARVRRVIWFGPRPLPTVGPASILTRKLAEEGIIYWAVPLPK